MELLLVNWFQIYEQEILFTESIIFLFFLAAVFYLFLFAVSSLRNKRTPYPDASRHYRFAVLVPAFMADDTIEETIDTLLSQQYPREQYDVFVISDMLLPQTEFSLHQKGIIMIHPSHRKASKAAALRYAINHILEQNQVYDIALLIDAHNLVEVDYLKKINDAFYSGCYALQTHRKAQSFDTSIAVIDATSEEINNSIFRKGHTNFGFSSALIGSGMAFDFPLFCNFIMQREEVSLNKELERYLLLDNVYIDYLEDVYIYDKKIEHRDDFSKQRRKWLSNQVRNLSLGVLDLPIALFKGQWDYCNKLFQWTLPPRVILLGMLFLIALTITFYSWVLAAKWWGLLLLFIATLSMAIPSYLASAKLTKAFSSLPWIFITMIFNHIHIFRSHKKYINDKETV